MTGDGAVCFERGAQPLLGPPQPLVERIALDPELARELLARAALQQADADDAAVGRTEIEQ